jgi:arginase
LCQEREKYTYQDAATNPDYIDVMSIAAVPYFMGEPMTGLSIPDPHVVLRPDLPIAEPQHRMSVLYNHLAEWVAATEHPVVYAGDCVVVIGVLSGLQRRGVDAALVFFDAHGDFNTWETTPSGFVGGMPLAMLTGRGEQTIVTGTGLTPPPDDRVLLVGARDIDPKEEELLARSQVTQVSCEDVVTAIPSVGPLYVHLDLDVVDPGDMPAMNYPAPGGPSLSMVHSVLSDLASTGRVVAFSLSSWNPALPGAGIAAAAAHELAAPFVEMGAG